MTNAHPLAIGLVGAGGFGEFCLDAFSAMPDAKIAAVVHPQADKARKAIKAGLPDGPFTGVPFLLKDLGCEAIDFGAACEQYRAAMVWGFYLWAITRRVEPPVIETFITRLGNAVARHESFALLGV